MAWYVPAMHAPRLRLPRPKKFLGFIPLQMGTQLISLTLLFNKLTGLYGLLAILTGFSLSATQLSAYLYNVLILVTVAFCFPHIQRETPLPNLVLAWTYAVDTVANAAYTAVFAASWYLAASATAAATPHGIAAASAASDAAATAAATMTAVTPGTSPAYIIATPALLRRDGELSATATVAAAAAETASAAFQAAVSAAAEPTATVVATVPVVSETAGSGGWMGAHESAASLTVIVIVTVVRVYFSLVVMAHTRRALQRYSEHVAAQSVATAGGADDSEVEEDKVDEDKDKEMGEGASSSSGAESGSGSGSGSSGSSNDAGGVDGVDEDKPDVDDEEVGLKSGTRSSKSRRGGRHAGRSRRRHRPAAATTAADSLSRDANPFAPGRPAGDGWQGKMGRALVRVGRSYWLERGQDDDWSRGFSSRFRTPLPI